MLMIRAIIRPEKSSKVLKALFEAGYVAVTKIPVVGRGKQRGIKIGDVTVITSYSIHYTKLYEYSYRSETSPRLTRVIQAS